MMIHKKLIFLFVFLFIVAGFFLFLFFKESNVYVPVEESIKEKDISPIHTIIGKSFEGRNIDAYSYGNGSTHLLFVGGIHGGYEWNSVVLAYQIMDYFDNNLTAIPSSLTVTIIPSLNPDGVFKVVGKEGYILSADIPANVATSPGRFNGNTVDLNRNFDCKWQPRSTWQNKIVSAGNSAFSEPEAIAFRDFVLKYKPIATVFWHSQSGSVYASKCEKDILPETFSLVNLYSKASGYSAIETFDSYNTTGAAEDWMASISMPAITVELTTHESIEFEKN